jgi:hypothetical protein
MKKKLLLSIAFNSIFFSHFAYAGAGWTDFVKVAELVPTNRHYYEVRLQVKKNPGGCKEKAWFYQNYESRGSDKMFEILLEGIKDEIQLRVYVTGVCNINGYSEFSSVSVIR